jgi:hypothetical protein
MEHVDKHYNLLIDKYKLSVNHYKYTISSYCATIAKESISWTLLYFSIQLKKNPNNLQYVKHKNGLLNDNRVSNIEWTANNPITTLNTLNNVNTLNTSIYPKIKHFVKYTICKNENNHSKKQLYFKTEKEALERIKTIQLTNPEYKSKVQKKVYYLTEITYNEKKFYKKHQDYLLVHRLHRQMYLVIKYCNLFLKLLNKNK